jgi:anthranilate synthase component I
VRSTIAPLGLQLVDDLHRPDLGDVGRVAEIGSAKATEQMVIERYSHVMHICSHVEGRLGRRYDAMDALCAGFPAGTLSGAPSRAANSS